MSSARVRLLLHGEPVREVPFQGAPLRIGRMKENDLVVNNLSVSRFHATLAQDGDGFLLTDLGSENGCWVNGRRVNESRVGPGDRILIGKHQLEIVVEEVAASAEAPAPRGRSDAWDAAATYFVGAETHAKMVAGAEPAAAAPAEALEHADTDGEPAPAAEAPAPPLPVADEGVELFGDAEPSGSLAGPDLAEFDVSELDLRPSDLPTAVRDEPVATLLGESQGDDGTQLVDLAAAQPLPDDAAAAERSDAPVHAGLIVQRGGRLERVVRWEAERLTMGRATECDVLLATPEVSRRHAMLVREGERFEVRDLESINGTFVNGEKISRRTLQVGDVIRVEDFEVTFVLDRTPVDEALKTDPRVAAPAAGRDPGLTQIGEMMDLAPFVAEGEAEPAEAMSFDSLPLGEPLPEIEGPGEADLALPAEPETLLLGDEAPGEADLALPAEPETVLLGDEGPGEVELALPAEPETVLLGDEEPGAEPDEEKDLVEAPGEPRVLRLDLRVRVEDLPPALRDALQGVDPADLLLPVELRIDPEKGPR